MGAIRLPEKQIRERLARFNPKLAEQLLLHNRGARRRWTNYVIKAELKLARAIARHARMVRGGAMGNFRRHV